MFKENNYKRQSVKILTDLGVCSPEQMNPQKIFLSLTSLISAVLLCNISETGAHVAHLGVILLLPLQRSGFQLSTCQVFLSVGG